MASIFPGGCQIGVIRLWSKSQLGDRTECVVLRWGKLGVMRFYPGAQLGTEAPRIQTPWREVRHPFPLFPSPIFLELSGIFGFAMVK